MSEDILFLKSGHVDFNAAVIGIGRSRWKTLPYDTTIEQAIQTMRKNRFDVIPIEEGKNAPIRECFHTNKLNVWTNETVVREPLSYCEVLPAQTPLYDLIQRFVQTEKLYFFLTYENNISGLVSLSNLNSRPVQVWLFAMLCELETRLGNLVSEAQVKDEDIFNEISKEYVKKIYLEDKEKGIENNITEYLYLTDLLKIVGKRKLYDKLGYKTVTQFNKLNCLNEIRKQVMHPIRSLINDGCGIERLLSRLELLQDILFRLRQFQGSY